MHRKRPLALIGCAKATNTPSNTHSIHTSLSTSSSAVWKPRCKNRRRSDSEFSMMPTPALNTGKLSLRRLERDTLRKHSHNMQNGRIRIPCSRSYSGTARVSSDFGSVDGLPKNIRTKSSNVVRVKPPRLENDVASRTIQMAPWRGPPTFLHALAFVRELEAKYGKIWWAGIEKNGANPYAYRDNIVVIFESIQSVLKIPGFTFNTVNRATGTDGPYSSSSIADAEKPNAITPLFVPWSETLNKAAYRKGGPALEDVLAFLEQKTFQPDIQPPSTTSSGSGDVPNPNKAAVSPKASWEEFDEAVSIDAVLKPWKTNRVFLPSPVHSGGPYLRPRLRQHVARAWVEFGGFSEEPVNEMRLSMDGWAKEIAMNQSNVWVPYTESEENRVAAETPSNSKEEEEKVQDDNEWEWEDLVDWGPPPTEGVDGGKPQYRYEPIGVVEGSEAESEIENEDWRSPEPHPLQFPASIPTSGLGTVLKAFSQSTSTSTPASTEKTGTFDKPATKTGRAWDTWRTDPRPFRNAVGAGNPPPSSSRSSIPPRELEEEGELDEEQFAIANRIERPSRSSWRERSAFTTYPARGGSYSAKSAEWGKDKRSAKMKQRDQRYIGGRVTHTQFGEVDDTVLERFRQAQRTGVPSQEPLETSDVQAEREKERQRLQEESRIRDRLRAILDGTN